ncbi:MAG: putative DNA binding domain-containing protein [Treponema sp.]|nr:putative DNA binding domain-containing protein [Treponema sp.]
MAQRTDVFLNNLVNELRKLPSEIEWVEFKCNNQNPQLIGEYISALSNSAVLCEKPYAYIVWGIDDKTHDVVSTSFDWQNSKKGNEQLEVWLMKLCSPKINFKFYDIHTEKGLVVLLEIPAATKQPTMFSGERYIRIGANKKNLKEFPNKERELWKMLDIIPFELKFAAENLTEDDVISLLDSSRYYDKMGLPFPRNRSDIISDFNNEKFIKSVTHNIWNITNMGAILIGKDLKKFDNLSKKTPRVIWYKNNNRLETIRECEFTSGYAYCNEEIINYIMTIIPQKETIENGIRKSIYDFPEIAIRELLANMLIHQDFEQRGTNPMIEIFSDRIEFSNPGAPLVNIERIIDTVPVSRNENIAGFMHKCGICEERGSGYDKIVLITGQNSMLAPRIENQDNQFTKVALFSKIPFDVIPKEEKIRTCYMHACLAYVNYSVITNTSIRKLFALDENEKVKASRIIKDTLAEHLIKPVDEESSPRNMKYIPIWA